ncbi:MAG: 2,3-bisphosphoglycerate-independent phosphoglycerate mutase [bacterium]|nr:2,3-bisphosphoglycerate-independent phosphoglycerate mutase [bacterium]
MTPITKNNPLILIILDGFGITLNKKGNAVANAKIPNLRDISGHYPGALLQASGAEVGLAWGEMGSSEVGHANLGAGTVVPQNLPKINTAIKDKNFFNFPVWKKAVEHAQANNSALHIMGLLSNGGVHAHIDHLLAILNIIKNLGYAGKLYLHVFTDGQDTAPKVAIKFIEPLEAELKKLGIGKIATVIGRYYSMDKSEHWDRTEKAYRCLTEAEGIKVGSPKEALDDGYAKNFRDETLEPYVISKDGKIKDNDALIFINYRADRTRQISRALVNDKFDKFSRNKLKNLYYLTMMPYAADIVADSVFPPDVVPNPLAKVLSEAGKTQFHIAETEKYAHVTYFFNGGTEEPFAGEERVIIPSKEVKSYDTAPEMSAKEILAKTSEILTQKKFDFLVVNFANGDMVGHTGNFEAGVKAVETLDEAVGKLVKEILVMNGVALITADHGNVEEMVNLETNEIDKEHSTNPVPVWLITPENRQEQPFPPLVSVIPQGLLGDVSPTILELMGVPQPADMSGTSLLNLMSSCRLPE